jgi:hypothetical protein
MQLYIFTIKNQLVDLLTIVKALQAVEQLSEQLETAEIGIARLLQRFQCLVRTVQPILAVRLLELAVTKINTIKNPLVLQAQYV